MKKILKQLLYKFLCIIPLRRVITFESFAGTNFCDSPKAIFDEFLNRKINIKLVIFINKNVILNEKYQPYLIYKGTLKWLFYTAVSKIWIKNTGIYGGLKKRKKQFYLQTWHGSPFKKDGHAANKNTCPVAHKNWDVVLSPGDFFNKCVNAAFNDKLNYLQVGYPRMDELINKTEDDVTNIKKILKIKSNKKIILYAPTYRDSQIKLSKIPNVLDTVSDEYIILYRLHYLLKNKTELPSNYIDVSDYNNINDLLLISDLLITDYSSVYADYLVLNKPIIFYLYDHNKYERDLWLRLDELPGPICYNIQELNTALKNQDNYWLKYKAKYDYLKEKYYSLEDGKSSQRVVDYLLKNI